MEERKGRRIIVFPVPFQGHLNPMLHLAGIFHRRGFSVTVLHASFNSPDPSLHPHFTFVSLNEENPPIVSEGSSPDLVALIMTLKARCAERFADALADAAAATGGEPVSCLVSDAIWGVFTQVAADNVGVKRLVLRTGGAASFCAFAAFPLLRNLGYLPIDESQLDEEVIELPPLKVKDLPVIQTENQEELYQIVNDMVNGAKSSAGVIWNTFQDLEQSSLSSLQHQLQVPIFPIGPFHKHESVESNTNISVDDDSLIMSWLDQQDKKSVLYVSFGSLAAISEFEFVEIAWGLRNSGRPFLWVVRPGMVSGSDWPGPLPNELIENLEEIGKIVKWANQTEVLGHFAIGAFWTHCGWNSVMESICEGVPMICMPRFTDQKVNARYVGDVWGIGAILNSGKMDREEIVRVIGRVMGDDELGIRVLKLKESADLCVGKDGSSSKCLEDLVCHVLSSDRFVFSSK